MPGLDFLTQIDTIGVGFQRPNPNERKRNLPIENRSTYRDTLNRSLKENRSSKDTQRPQRDDSTETVGSRESDSRPESAPSRESKYRDEPNSTTEISRYDETENRSEIPKTVLDRLETNIAQIVPNIDDFPNAPPGLADSINPVISILFEVGTESITDATNLELQIDTEEIPVVPAGLLEVIGQFNGDEIRQNSTEGSEILVDELRILETLIQNEVSTEIPLMESEGEVADSRTPETNIVPAVTEEIAVEAQVPVIDVDGGFEKKQPSVSLENEQIQDIIPIESVVEELKVEETVITENIGVEEKEADSSTIQNVSSEENASSQSGFSESESDRSHSEPNQTTIPITQNTEQTLANKLDATTEGSEENSIDRSKNENSSFANSASQAANRSETGQVASRVSRDGPLPSPSSQQDTEISDRNASIQSVAVKETTPAAMKAAKDQNPVQLIERVAQAVRVSQQSGRTMKFRLQPPELGTLQVEIRQDNGVMTARLEVQTAAALKAISENMSQLREAMQQAGANIEQIDVQLIETKNDDRPSQERGREHRQNGEDRNQPRNRDSAESEAESGDENDPVSQTDSGGEQVDIQV